MAFNGKSLPELRARAIAECLGQRGEFDYYPGRITPGWYSGVGTLSVREMLAGVLAWFDYNDVDGKNITPDTAGKTSEDAILAWVDALRVVPQVVLIAVYDAIQEDLRAGPKLVIGSGGSSSENSSQATSSFSPGGTTE